MKKTFTAFCQETSGEGTIWIDCVEAETTEQAIEEARRACAYDWDYDLADVHVLGIAEGDVNILYWEDKP